MKTKSPFLFALLMAMITLSTSAGTEPAEKLPPPCTTSHSSFILSTSPLAVETCQNSNVSAFALSHCNARNSYGYRWVITNSDFPNFSRTYTTSNSNWSGTCHDLREGYNTITLYYRTNSSDTWVQYALGGITLTCVDCGPDQ